VAIAFTAVTIVFVFRVTQLRGAGGEITLEAFRNDDEVMIRVADTGIAITPEFLPNVFERFTQADTSPTRAHGGVGLGLAIAKHLVELMGGEITAESSGIGKGASFAVRLPGVHDRQF
jgi:signal transduction histidine kinase